MPFDGIGEALIHAKLNPKKLVLNIMADGRILVVNPTDEDITLAGGSVVASFGGKGKWVASENIQDPQRCVEYQVDASQKVLLGNQAQSIEDIIQDQRKAQASQAKVRYYEMVEEPKPGNPGHFTLKREGAPHGL